ncbi:MAG: type II secretion protein F [Blautia sp.]
MKFKSKISEEKNLFIISLILLFTGNASGIGITLWQYNTRAPTHTLERREYGSGDYEEILTVRTEDGNTQEIVIRIPEKTYTPKKARELLTAAYSRLESVICGKNKSLDQIHFPLLLPETLEDSPVHLFWTTSSPDLLSWEGEIGDCVESDGSSVTLRCELYLGEESLLWEKDVTVYPEKKAPEEALEQFVQKAVLEKADSPSSRLTLPETIQGKSVTFYKDQEKTGIWISFFSTLLGLSLIPLKKQREKEKAEAVRREMQMDYPDILSKLLLFLQAGLTVRNSFEKISEDYLQSLQKYGMNRRISYEEITETCRELQGGMPEIQAYERFGNRCPASEYKVLSVLLIQNLKKGNQSILLLLERESTEALEDRKRQARIQGEQASSKLVFPMLLQLIIVLTLLMFPAFLSFY